MKVLSKIKFIVAFIDISLVVCGIFFLGGFFKKTPIDCRTLEKVEKEQEEKNSLVEDFAACQNELFLAKNRIEKLKSEPDIRKDVVQLLLIARNMENDIGLRKNFSNHCVKLFALSSRIPIVQQQIAIYKDSMFKSNCIYYNTEEVKKMIIPFQVKFLEQQREQENKQAEEKLYRRVFSGIKFYVSKLFVKSNVKKSELEIFVEQKKYKQAVEFLNNGNFEKNDEFNTLYSAVVDLKNLQELTRQIFTIIGEDVVFGGDVLNYDDKK